MITMAKWLNRSFKTLPEANEFPMIIERLRGAPVRAEEKVRGLSSNVLTWRDGDKWSIQEHLGHLYDLEELWTGRFDDFSTRKETLRPWDGVNKKTYEANHNDSSIEELLSIFRKSREAMIQKLEQFGEREILATAQHPRLKQPMRAIDLVHFIAEHDDHHLAMIEEIMRSKQG